MGQQNHLRVQLKYSKVNKTIGESKTNILWVNKPIRESKTTILWVNKPIGESKKNSLGVNKTTEEFKQTTRWRSTKLSESPKKLFWGQ